MNTEQYLQEHMGEYRDRWLQRYPEEAPPHRFSRRFERKMDKLLRRMGTPAYTIDKQGDYVGMKQLWRAILVALLAALLLGAYALLPRFEWVDGRIRFRALGAQMEEGLVKIQVNVRNLDTPEPGAVNFEIFRDIRVYTDPEMTVLLGRRKGCTVDGDIWEYTFKVNGDPPEKIYIQPMVLGRQSRVEPVSGPVSVGSTICTADGKPWITFTEVGGVSGRNTKDKGKLRIVAEVHQGELMPRTPEIEIGGVRYLCGFTGHRFDDEGYCLTMEAICDEVRFADAVDPILHLEEVLQRCEADESLFSSEGIELIVGE